MFCTDVRNPVHKPGGTMKTLRLDVEALDVTTFEVTEHTERAVGVTVDRTCCSECQWTREAD